MNYKESKEILDMVNKSDTVLLSCHQSADPDSLVSAGSLKYVLEKMGKKVYFFSPEKVASAYDSVIGFTDIKVKDFNKLNYSKYSLYIISDSEHWGRVGREERPKHIKVVNIDHHFNNSIGGDINLLDFKAASASEIIYYMLKDWKTKLDIQLSQNLLTGICSDTGFFQFTNTTPNSLKVAAKLIEKGASLDKVVLNLKRNRSLDILKFWGEMLNNIKIDDEFHFAWSAVSFEDYKKYNIEVSPTSEFVDSFLRTIKATNFAVAMVEKQPEQLHLSFRARISGFDVSPIARELGGGGHKDSSGAAIHGLNFETAVDRVLVACRKFAHKRPQKV